MWLIGCNCILWTMHQKTGASLTTRLCLDRDTSSYLDRETFSSLIGLMPRLLIYGQVSATSKCSRVFLFLPLDTSLKGTTRLCLDRETSDYQDRGTSSSFDVWTSLWNFQFLRVSIFLPLDTSLRETRVTDMGQRSNSQWQWTIP